MKALIVAVCSWPLTELYWNITARYEFPFFVTVAALLVWLMTVRFGRKEVEIGGEVETGSVGDDLGLPATGNGLPWIEQARVFARDIAKRTGVVSINDIHGCIARGMLPAPADQRAFAAVFSKGFVDTGERIKAVTLAARKKGRVVNVWRLAE